MIYFVCFWCLTLRVCGECTAGWWVVICKGRGRRMGGGSWLDHHSDSCLLWSDYFCCFYFCCFFFVLGECAVVICREVGGGSWLNQLPINSLIPYHLNSRSPKVNYYLNSFYYSGSVSSLYFYTGKNKVTKSPCLPVSHQSTPCSPFNVISFYNISIVIKFNFAHNHLVGNNWVTQLATS